MFMGAFEYYLIGANVVGFFLYLINMWFYSHTAEGQVDKFLTILSLFGGSVGILLSILIFDRKTVKDNMMSRVCMYFCDTGYSPADGKRPSCRPYYIGVLDFFQSIQNTIDLFRHY